MNKRESNMNKEAYIQGFIQACKHNGVDPVKLAAWGYKRVEPGDRAIVDGTGKLVTRKEIQVGKKPLFTGAQYNASKKGKMPYSLKDLAAMRGHDEWQKRLASKIQPKTQLVAKK